MDDLWGQNSISIFEESVVSTKLRYSGSGDLKLLREKPLLLKNAVALFSLLPRCYFDWHPAQSVGYTPRFDPMSNRTNERVVGSRGPIRNERRYWSEVFVISFNGFEKWKNGEG